MTNHTIRIFTLLCSLAGFYYCWYFEIPHTRSSPFQLQAETSKTRHTNKVNSGSREAPTYQARSASDDKTREVHSSTAYFSPADKTLHAYWYGGTREGATDVSIYGANFIDGEWSPSREIINPLIVQEDTHRFTRKVGNPAVYQWTEGEVWLFFVSTSVGGWGGSSINLIRSIDEGQSWSKTQKLITTPFLNISTLVRGSAFTYQDGSMGIPVYHESIGKFGELLRINRAGRIIEKTRLSDGNYSLQPVISPMSPDSAVGFLRYAGEEPHRLLRIATSNQGTDWSKPVKLNIPNPNSAVASLAIGERELLLVFNDAPEGRVDLALGYSSDMGRTFRRIHYPEYSGVWTERHDFQFSYPSILKGEEDEYHILYTHNRLHIKHILFNEAWLQGRIAGTL